MENIKFEEVTNEEDISYYMENFCFEEEERNRVKTIFRTTNEDIDYGNIYFHIEKDNSYYIVIEREGYYGDDINEVLKLISSICEFK